MLGVTRDARVWGHLYETCTRLHVTGDGAYIVLDAPEVWAQEVYGIVGLGRPGTDFSCMPECDSHGLSVNMPRR